MNTTSLLALMTVLITSAFLIAEPASSPPVSSLPGQSVHLRSVSELQQLVSGEFINPTAEDLLGEIRNKTRLKMSLVGSITADIPIQGYTKFEGIPAWVVLEQLARNKYLLGNWRKVGNEYRLFASYRGPPPRRPPPVPSEVVAAIRGETGHLTSRSGLGLSRLLGIGSSLALLAAGVVWASRLVKARIISSAGTRQQ